METPEPKPKRQLTEAQRLAFMKGREKRLANLAKKREEKMNLNEDIKSPPEAIVPMVIPDETPKHEAPPAPHVQQQLELDDAAMEKLAKLVADKVTVRPKARRPYTKRVQVPVYPPSTTKESSSPKTVDIASTQDNTAYPVPQRTYFWM